MKGIREAAKKVLLLNFNLFFQRSKISEAIKLKGGGGLGPAINRRTFFCGFP